jgi:hypothetical protein
LIPILFGPGFAQPLTVFHGLRYFSKISSLWLYGGMCSPNVRSIDLGRNHDGD